LDGVKEDGRIKHFFGNGRGVRTFFQYMQIGLAVRLANESADGGDLYTFKQGEIDFAYETFRKGSDKLAAKTEDKVKIGFYQK